MSASATDRKKLLLVIAGLGAAAVALFVVNRQLDAFLYAWDNRSSGRPTLSGTWVGRLTTGSGRPRGVFMELHRWKPQRGLDCPTCAHIEGTALVCDERGGSQRYRVGGEPGDRHATTLHLGVSPVAQPPPDGLELSSMRGRWDGVNALPLEAQFHWRKGASAISGSDDPDTKYVPLPMRRGTEDEYRAVCRALAP
jgi:hypothetical protein